jgi:long-chain acyl-CoA synthetase
MLAPGRDVLLEKLEAHYRQSVFVTEICVMSLAGPDQPMAGRLHAVVVPNLELLRRRRMVNAGDILRFELEGLSHDLPAHERVLGYDVWFDPLPRTTAGEIKRHEVERRLWERRRAAAEPLDAPLPAAEQRWLDDPGAARVVGLIRLRLNRAVRIRPDSNLELDLGLDSMERVELLTELEQRLGTRLTSEAASAIFTVRELVDALRPASGEARAEVEEPWAVLLRRLPPGNDPVLSALLEPKPFATPLLFLVSRLFRLLLSRVRVTGVERLPRSGAFILCPNHQSFLDPMFLCGVLPYRVFRNLFFVGAVEYFETPFTRWVARTVNCLPVDPDSNLVPAMQAGAFGLTHGKTLILFPEGERSIDGGVKKFKKGAPILAQHLRAPIVPVALTGVYELWPRNRPFNWSVVWPWSGHRITVVIGEPMAFPPDESSHDAAERLRSRVVELFKIS